MKVDLSKTSLTIASDLKPEVRVFNDVTGEIVFRCNVISRKKRYEDIPLVILTIDDDPDNDQVIVDDEYFRHIPYPKPIIAFREYFVEELKSLLAGPILPLFIYKGVEQYIADLFSFSDIASVVREAKSAVNTLDAKRAGSYEKALDVLAALKKTPQMEVPFEGPRELFTLYRMLVAKKETRGLKVGDREELDRLETLLLAFALPENKLAFEKLRGLAKK